MKAKEQNFWKKFCIVIGIGAGAIIGGAFGPAGSAIGTRAVVTIIGATAVGGALGAGINKCVTQ